MTDQLVKSRDAKRMVRVVPAAKIEHHLPQAEQIKMVDQKRRPQHDPAPDDEKGTKKDRVA